MNDQSKKFCHQYSWVGSTTQEICQKSNKRIITCSSFKSTRMSQVDKQKLTFSKQASSCTDTLFCLEDHLLGGGPDDLVSTFQPNTVIPADSILRLKIIL